MGGFAENLEVLLQQNHMTRAELAEKIGVNKSTVTAWFKRGGAGVHLDSAIAICDLFDITLDQLARGEIPAKNDAFSAEEVAQLKRIVENIDKIFEKEGR